MLASSFAPWGMPTMIGSLPHTDIATAIELVYRHLPSLPAWPQLTHLGFRETMFAQVAAGLPGVVEDADRVYVDRRQDATVALEQLYYDYLRGVAQGYGLDEAHAGGFHAFAASGRRPLWGAKGQIAGPVSFCMAVTDNEQRAILYDEVLSDAAAKLLRLKAAWQERQLRQVASHTVVFVDEPTLASLGSGFVAMPREQVVSLLEEVLGGITGLSGIHCCGNTDWPLLLSTSADILSLDGYDYGESLTLFADEVAAFLARGGAIAWGMTPTQETSLAGETAASLFDRWEAHVATLARKGVAAAALRERCLITPACGLDSLSEVAAERALELTAELAATIEKRYKKE